LIILKIVSTLLLDFYQFVYGFSSKELFCNGWSYMKQWLTGLHLYSQI